jgi:hypothetical protein
MTNVKPPIGIIPKKFWDERRYVALIEAINRYLNANLQDIPDFNEWVEEATILAKTTDKDILSEYPLKPILDKIKK